MSPVTKKPTHRSPNYPIKPLDWAVQTALGLLEKEGKHAVPADIVAQNLGYKDAKNGRVRRILANLKAFGVLEKSAGGKLAVSEDIARYKIMPTEDGKKALLQQWLHKPGLFGKLLDKYGDDLPSDKVLLFELVDDHGFSESAAESAINVFRASRDFVFLTTNGTENELNVDEADNKEEVNDDVVEPELSKGPPLTTKPIEPNLATNILVSESCVRYPVRLAGKRMAWIDVPEPFYEADKRKLLAQIEIIGTEDEDYDLGDT